MLYFYSCRRVFTPSSTPSNFSYHFPALENFYKKSKYIHTLRELIRARDVFARSFHVYKALATVFLLLVGFLDGVNVCLR